MNLGTITDTLSWYKISLLREYNLIRIKSKLHRRRRRVYERSWDRCITQKLFTFSIHWDLTNPVKNYHGIIGLLTSSFRNKQNYRASYTKSKRRNVSRIIAVWIGREVVVRFHQMLMLSAKCARIPCRRKTKLRMKKRFVESFLDPIIPPTHKWNNSQTPKSQSENPSIRKENLTMNLHRLCFDRDRNFKGRRSDY